MSKAALAEGAAPPRLYADDLADVVRTGTVVTAIDRDRRVVVTEDGDVPYGTLLLATGAAPRLPPVPGLAPPAVHVLRDAADGRGLAAALRPGAHLLVVGGGLIGLEVAASARDRDVEVTVVEAAARPMARVLPAALSEPLVAAHRAAGTGFEVGVPPTGLTSDGERRVLTLADGRELVGDVVLVATGVAPRTALAEAAGLAVEDGILVDAFFRTSDPTVLAVGDAVRVRGEDGLLTARTEAWTPALAMGQHAARVILGEAPAPYAEVPWAWSDQLGLRVQVAGAPVGSDVVLRGGLDAPEGLLVLGLDGDRVVGAAGMSRGTGVGRVVRGAVGLIQSGRAVDRAALADPGTDLRALAAG